MKLLSESEGKKYSLQIFMDKDPYPKSFLVVARRQIN